MADYASAYGKLADLAEAAISDQALSAKFKKGDKVEIEAELTARGFTVKDLDVLRKGRAALAPTGLQPGPEAAAFWWW